MLGSLNSKITSLENTHILKYFQDIFNITLTSLSEFNSFCKENSIRVLHKPKASTFYSKQVLIYKQNILINTIDIDIDASLSNIDIYISLLYSIEHSKEILLCLNT